MKKFIAVMVLAIGLVSCGACVTDCTVGMTEDEVVNTLGEPTSKVESSSSSAINGESVSASNATWTYDGDGVVNFTDGKVVSVYEKK